MPKNHNRRDTATIAAVPCPTCGAPIGTPCLNPHQPHDPVHTTRLLAHDSKVTGCAPETLAEIWALVVDIADAHDATPMTKHPRPWYLRIDEQWEISINGGRQPAHCTQISGQPTAPIPATHMLVQFNGFPAGLLSPYDGVIAAGTTANDNTLIAALRAHLRRTLNPPQANP